VSTPLYVVELTKTVRTRHSFYDREAAVRFVGSLPELDDSMSITITAVCGSEESSVSAAMPHSDTGSHRPGCDVQQST